MARPVTLEVRTYRGHQLELCDDGGDGWFIAIYPLRRGVPEVLCNSTPYGLAALLAEAERRVDQWLDGTLEEGPRGH